MDQATIDLVEAGDMCQCCGGWMPEPDTVEAGHGLGAPVSCQKCIDDSAPIVDRTPD